MDTKGLTMRYLERDFSLIEQINGYIDILSGYIVRFC